MTPRLSPQKSIVIAFTLLCMTLQAGCLSWFSDKVATGVARLTVRNLAAITTAISNDTTCGFSNEQVDASYVYEGDAGGSGTATWRVENCLLEFNEWTDISTDCEGTATRVKGAVVVTAEKVVTGHLTGNPEKPAIPSTSESVIIKILSATPRNFTVKKSNNKNWLKMKNGAITGNVHIKMVMDETNGVCSIPTPNVKISDVVYTEKTDVHVSTPSNEFDVVVEDSNITAINGVYGGKANQLSGTVKIFGKTETVPMSGDTDGLDPDYSANEFKGLYACLEDIKLPESDSCDITAPLGEGAARLTVRNFGTLAKYVSDEDQCGFESPAVKASPTIYGAVGHPGGEVVYTVERCRLTFPQLTTISTDCLGKTVSVQGTVTFSGTKTVRGYITGDPENPVVPNTSLPGTLTLDAKVRNFHVVDSSSPKSLIMKTGTLKGSLTPKMMLDTTTGVCSEPTANAVFENVRLLNSEVRLESEGTLLGMTIKNMRLEAVNGVVGERENHLSGTVNVNNTDIVVPLDTENQLLDPDYHPIQFIDTYDCLPDTLIPKKEEECSFRKVLAQGAARLLVKNFGIVTKAIDLDTTCGFGNTMQLLGGLVDTELLAAYSANAPYTADWLVGQCQLNHSGVSPRAPGHTLAPVTVETDCEGTRIKIKGQATVTGRKEVTGKVALSYPPLLPQNRDSANFQFTEILFDDFAAYEVRAGETEAAGAYLILHNGVMTGNTYPVTGEASDTPGAFFIKTPVSRFENVVIRDADATLKLGAMTFHFRLDESNLDAFNGSYNGNENWLYGGLTLDGHVMPHPFDADDQSLDPEYDQAAFDATYSCKENLKETVPQAFID